MAKGRIPLSLTKFDLYIKRFVEWLTTIKSGQTLDNATRNNITTLEVGACQATLAKWWTGIITSPGAYELHTNPATKTKLTRITVLNVQKEFRAEANPLLDRLSGSANITSEDRELLNIAEPVTSHTPHTAKITAPTYTRNRVVGPGKIEVKCYAAQDSSRASINETAGANSVQLAICIVVPGVQPDSENVGRVKATAPLNADECVYREIHTKATILIEFPLKYRKCDIYIYARQYDVTHDSLAGPWSEVLITPVP